MVLPKIGDVYEYYYKHIKFTKFELLKLQIIIIVFHVITILYYLTIFKELIIKKIILIISKFNNKK